MTVTGILDAVTQWAQESICPQILLKVPPEDDAEATGAGYDYKRINPTAFTMFLPARDKLPPSILSPVPSVCVRCTEGEDDLSTNKGLIQIQLAFSAWNPGVYGGDVVLPNPEDGLRPKKWTGPEAEAYFRRSADGWRDVWNMVDIALRELESVTTIGGLLIDRATPIKYGPFTEQKVIVDYYPFWYAWASFALQYPIIRNVRGVTDYL